MVAEFKTNHGTKKCVSYAYSRGLRCNETMCENFDIQKRHSSWIGSSLGWLKKLGNLPNLQNHFILLKRTNDYQRSDEEISGFFNIAFKVIGSRIF